MACWDCTAWDPVDWLCSCCSRKLRPTVGESAGERRSSCWEKHPVRAIGTLHCQNQTPGPRHTNNSCYNWQNKLQRFNSERWENPRDLGETQQGDTGTGGPGLLNRHQSVLQQPVHAVGLHHSPLIQLILFFFTGSWEEKQAEHTLCSLYQHLHTVSPIKLQRSDLEPLYCVLPPRSLQKSVARLPSQFTPSSRRTISEAWQPRSLRLWMADASSDAWKHRYITGE